MKTVFNNDVVVNLYFWSVSFFVFVTINSFSTSYSAFYYGLLISIIIWILNSNGISRLLSLLFGIYIALGLWDISNYRGEFTLDLVLNTWILVLVVSFFALFFLNEKINIWKLIVVNQNFEKIIRFHLLFSYLILLVIIFKYGMIFLNQDLRFKVPASLGYLARSASVIPLVIALISMPPKRKVYYVILSLIPTIFLGARGTAVTVLVSYLYIYINQSGYRIKILHFKTIFILTIIITIIYSGFYLRRVDGSGWASPHDLIEKYMKVDGIIAYAIMPLHLGFRETFGIANNIMVKGLNNSSSISLLWLDFLTVLPGEQISSGKALGDIVGRSGGGGLTPSIIGSFYLDFGVTWYRWFILLVCSLFYYIRRKLKESVDFAIVTLIAFQFFHLFHRGYPKIEYLFFFTILTIYIKFLNRYKNESTTHSI
jgi:hypothetical protein